MSEFKKGIYLISFVVAYICTWIGSIIVVATSANKNIEVLIIAVLNALVFGYTLSKHVKDNADK